MENKKTEYICLLLVLVVFASGCTQATQVVGGGLVMKLQSDPKSVFAEGNVRLNIDLDNKNTRGISDIRFDVFDTGILRENTQCDNSIDAMKSDEFKTFWCVLTAPGSNELISDKTTATISAKASYATDFPVVQVIEMMTQEEYARQSAIGKFKPKPAKYSYKDDNIQLDIEFSDQLPIVIRPGKDYYVYFTIRNIGNGFTKSLDRRQDFIVEPVRPESPRIANCDDPSLNPYGIIEAVGKEFPRITCKLVMPGNVEALENYGLLILVKYNYEVRDSASVDVVK